MLGVEVKETGRALGKLGRRFWGPAGEGGDPRKRSPDARDSERQWEWLEESTMEPDPCCVAHRASWVSRAGWPQSLGKRKATELI